ncbi:hypothetical protein PAMP_018692 [Pampus punctatissimus]
MINVSEPLLASPKLRVSLFAFLLFLLVSLGDARLHRTRRVSSPTEETVETYDKYYNYVDLTSRLQSLARKYPHIANLSSIGQSVEGRELWVMRITKDPNTDTPGKPRFKYVGNMHGDETVSRQVLVYLVEYLLAKYGEEPRITELVNTTDIYIMPSMNPDGFEKSEEGECNGNTGARNNAKDNDLNRSFPDQYDDNTVDPDDIPEVMALIKWIQEKKFVLSANLHGGTVVASYPFDDSPSHPVRGQYSEAADDRLFRYLSLEYSQHHPLMKTGQPNCDNALDETFKDGITNGAEWYDVPGGMQDYNYLHGNCMEITIELSCCKHPLAVELHKEWDMNRESLLAYIEKVHIGVRGYVKEAISGAALTNVSILVAGIRHNLTTGQYGDYYRLLVPGTYNITAVAKGYTPMMVHNVQVIEGKPTELNFTLTPVVSKTLGSITVPTTSMPSTNDPATIPSDFTRVVPSEGNKSSTPPKHQPTQPQVFRHHNYADMEVFLRKYSSEFPSITHLVSIGRSVDDRELYVMIISDNPTVHEHGDVKGSKGRWNGNNIDLNRNFPDQFTTSEDPRQPETIAVMNWLKSIPFVLSANLHGGSLVVNYPYDDDKDGISQYSRSPDDSVFQQLSRAYSQENPLMHNGHPCDDIYPGEYFEDGITNGANWYSISGGMQDWNYLNTNCFEVTIELGCTKYPMAETLPKYWEQNRRALLQFIHQVHTGIKGTVSDIQDGTGIPNATISVEGIDHTITTAYTGDYWRLLVPGTYSVVASAHGYTPVTTYATVSKHSVEVVDFRLTRVHSDSNGQSPKGNQRVQNPSEKEFHSLIKDLSLGQGLEQLVRSTATENNFHYRRYKEMSSSLRGLTLNFPKITSLKSLGQSVEFRTIWALEISNKPGQTEPSEPKVRFVAGIHGNAPVGTELLLEFATFLCINYGKNPAITKLINETRIVIVPSINPDGREQATEKQCTSTQGLTNAHGKDLDTDFFGNASQRVVEAQPETRAMMDLILDGSYTLSVALDGGSLVATYPYDKPVQSVGNIPDGVMRAAERQSHMGSMKDFSMDFGHCPEITVYSGCCLFPPTEQLATLWAENKKSLLSMLVEVHKGVRGMVRDKSGKPIVGAIIVLNGGVRVFTVEGGYFHALLAPGNHNIEAVADGYQQQRQEVVVSSYEAASSIIIEFDLDNSIFGLPREFVVASAAASMTALVVTACIIWCVCAAKSNRQKDGFHRLRQHRDEYDDEIRLTSMGSKKSLLANEFQDESESDEETLYANKI